MLELEWVSMIEEMKTENKLTPFVLKLYNAFGPKIFGRSVIPLCYSEEIFDTVLFGKKFDTILDIGTGNGIPAAYMAQYCRQVITIDIVDNPIRNDVLKLFGANSVYFIKVKTEGSKEDIIKDILFDFCYMDGAHSTYTYSDWMMVRKCGHVLFHEYYDGQKPVFDLVNSLPSDEVTKFIRHKEIYHHTVDLSELPCVDFAYWERA
jgi:SAM-dependent methyltransferase